MNKAIGIATAAALSLGIVAAPTPSSAHPALIPVLIAVGVGALVVGAVAANAAEQNGYGRRGTVLVGPDHELVCHTVRRNGVRRQVCS